MPSPFPGMDPFLEEPSLWPDVHSSLISYIRETLQPQLRPKYIARIGERIELTTIQKGYIPDVLLVQPPREPVAAIGHSGTLVVDEPVTFEMLDEARRVPYIEILYRETGDVVTLIEVLSPANKYGDGREQYLKKQADLLTTQVNLVEIDLLSGGRSTTLARNAKITNPPDWRYVVCINRVRRRDRLEIYAFGLRDHLPRCRIPLRAADPDVALDLPAVFARCYDVGGYDLLIDYQQEPPISLNEGEQGWLQELLESIRRAASTSDPANQL
ncbi:MAG: DUF4058 family protein [Caldilineaceae bacterium]